MVSGLTGVTGWAGLETPGRRWLAAVAVLAGALGAFGLALGGTPAERMLSAVTEVAQSLISVVTPFFGVLLVGDLRRSGRRAAGATYRTATLLAVVLAAMGLLVGVLATAVADAPDRWQHVGLVVLGSVGVQLVAMGTGVGWGLLLSRPAVAMAATVVVPLGLYLVLGLGDGLRPAREWLTPYAAVQQVFSGTMTALDWLQWAVIAAIWDVGLNLLGWRRFRPTVDRNVGAK